MNDIFDEVDDILDEADSETLSGESADSVDKNFNESELQDIMAEIENLEKEFVEPVQATAPTPVTKVEVKKEITREVEVAATESKTATTVLSFEKNSNKQKSSAVTDSSSEISFAAQGQMNLNLEFRIGDEIAKLTIDPIKGLLIIMSGVELCINQDDGCKVTMNSGVNFTIPLTSEESNFKKKSA